MDNEPEIWKKIDYLENRYEISNYGRLKSVDFYDLWNRFRKGRILKIGLDRRGYPRARISIHDKKKSLRIHQLVARAFIENPNKLPEVNHIDGVKTNNFYKNLEWITSSGNQKHAIKMGLKTFPLGEKHQNFIAPILVFDVNGQHIETLYGNRDAKNKGYEIKNISACLFGRRKTHKNCTYKRDLT